MDRKAASATSSAVDGNIGAGFGTSKSTHHLSSIELERCSHVVEAHTLLVVVWDEAA